MNSVQLSKYGWAFVKSTITKVGVRLGKVANVVVGREDQNLVPVTVGGEKEVVASFCRRVGCGEVNVRTTAWECWSLLGSPPMDTPVYSP
jgi:hypothetical protein